MPLLTLLAGFWFGGDAAALSSPDYRTRRDAHARLSAAGWLAYPALLSPDTPEAEQRCGLLVEALPSAADLVDHACERAVARILAAGEPAPELTPAAWLALEGAVCRAAERAAPVSVRPPNGAAAFELRENFLWWVRAKEFCAGSHPGEVRLLCESVRLKRQKRPE